MTTRQRARRDELRNTLARIAAQRDEAIAKLVRLDTKLHKTAKQVARAEKALRAATAAALAADTPHGTGLPIPPKVAPLPPAVLAECRATADDDPIPDFLDRRKAGEQKDAEARARIEAEQAEAKKAKAAVRIEKLKVAQEKKHAKLTGATKRMPLTGKAALEFIQQG